MSYRQFYFVANWKMELTFKEEMKLATEYLEEFTETKDSQHKIVVCPSALSISNLTQIFMDSPQVSVGSQICSPHSSGKFTGQISAASLNEIGCLFCVIGHREQAKDFYSYKNTVPFQLSQLLANNIAPIICIGESIESFKSGKAIDEIKEQLSCIESAKEKSSSAPYGEIFLAYDPAHTMGAKTLEPLFEHIESVLSWLKNYSKEIFPALEVKILYGGGVSAENIDQLKNMGSIDGILAGKSGLSAKKMKEIVELV